MQTLCNELQQNLVRILLGTVGEVFRPNYVATYGNLIESKDNTTDFVEISYPEPNLVGYSFNKTFYYINFYLFILSNRTSIQILILDALKFQINSALKSLMPM